MTKQGAKILEYYWTLGRYDAVTIVEGPDEKTTLKWLLLWGTFYLLKPLSLYLERKPRSLLSSHQTSRIPISPQSWVIPLFRDAMSKISASVASRQFVCVGLVVRALEIEPSSVVVHVWV
jgi:hypothetical protein